MHRSFVGKEHYKMPVERPAIEPIRTAFRVQYLNDEQLDSLQGATLRILEDVGVKFPSVA